MDNDSKNAIYRFIVGKLNTASTLNRADPKAVLFYYLDNSGTIDPVQIQIDQLSRDIALDQGQDQKIQADIATLQAKLDNLKKPPPLPPPVPVNP